VPTPIRAAVLYDEDCGFCKWAVDKVLASDRRRALTSVAIQSDEGQRLLATIPESERLDSWHLALPSGEILSAEAAAAPLARMLPGGGGLAFLFERFPGSTERAYRYVANHRSRFARLVGADPGCEPGP
jgi:predicted DCC family thiol-disulfide oxidoreductase YuxK